MNCTLICNFDGALQTGELCDDGNAINGDGCSSCMVDTGYSCNAAGNVCTPVCGDGLVVGNETCDDWTSTFGLVGCQSGC